MATTIVAYINVQGAKIRHIRGTVGVALALVAIVREPVVRVTVQNNDATAANTVAVDFGRYDAAQPNQGGTAAAVATSYLIAGNSAQTFYCREGDVLTAIAAADRDVSFLIQNEGSCN